MVHFEIKDLSFYYPTEKKKPALSHINLKIERGQYVTVCGKSGSGKTTLLRHLKSVLAPHGKTEGEIFFEGKPLKDADLRTQIRCGMSWHLGWRVLAWIRRPSVSV